MERRASTDALLLITRDRDEAHSQVARRLSNVLDARVCPLGADIRAELERVLSRGPPRVVAVPLSLFACDPLAAELAGVLRWARARWPQAVFLQSPPLGTTKHVVGWASGQARSALTKHAPSLGARPGEDGLDGSASALLVVGAGSCAAVNAEVCAAARLLAEAHDYELAEVAFARDARPTVSEGLRRLTRLGARRIVLVPLTLLDGQIYRAVCGQAEAAKNGDVVLCGPLVTPAAAAAVVRRRYDDAVERWLTSNDDGLLPIHDHDLSSDSRAASDNILPPRYRGGVAVSAASMGSAPLIFNADGQAAWDRMWSSFCHLALAGGPPHRGTLLEPPLRDEVLADPDASAKAAAEIARGLALVTRLPIAPNTTPGWVGLVCPDEEMARWLLRAIVVENVSVRREGATLFLPAGPHYRVEKEIKNVITAVAKTYHYWTEHRSAR